MHPTLAQYQNYLRGHAKLKGKGFYLQKALFEAMHQLSPVFDNLEVNGIYIQDQPLEPEQFQLLQRFKSEIVLKAREYIQQDEMRDYLETQTRGITREQLAMERVDELKRRSEAMDYNLRRLMGEIE